MMTEIIIDGVKWARSKAHISTEAWFVKIDGVKWTIKKKYGNKNWSLYSKNGKECERYIGYFPKMIDATRKMAELTQLKTICNDLLRSIKEGKK